jgi:uncharacterized protein YjbJ (UPF0337 family)
MKSSTKDQIEGKLHELKGRIKARAGQVTNNPKLEAEGHNEQIAGNVRKKIGQIGKVFGTSTRDTVRSICNADTVDHLVVGSW